MKTSNSILINLKLENIDSILKGNLSIKVQCGGRYVPIGDKWVTPNALASRIKTLAKNLNPKDQSNLNRVVDNFIILDSQGYNLLKNKMKAAKGVAAVIMKVCRIFKTLFSKSEGKRHDMLRRLKHPSKQPKVYTHDQLKAVGLETIQLAAQMDSKKVEHMKANTHLYTWKNLEKSLAKINLKTYDPTEFVVENSDTFAMAKKLIDQGDKPLAMNFANPDTPGGGWRRGAKAQEEAMFRSSNYFQSLEFDQNPQLKSQFPNGKYDLSGSRVIYTPGVQVFRKPEGENFEPCTPFSVDCVAVAAPYLASRRKEDTPQDYEDQMKNKLRSSFGAALLHGCDTLLLGAIGCGAFNGDPKLVARYTKEVLEEDLFKNKFKKIAFAVFAGKNIEQAGQSDANLVAFKEQFQVFRRERL